MKNEELFKDLVSFLPSIFLMLGFFLALGMGVFAPYHEVSIEIQSPIYKLQKIGDVPQNHLDNEKSPGYRAIYANVPELNREGKPVLKKSNQTFRGRGTPIVTVDNVYEITLPQMGSPPWKKARVAREVVEGAPSGIYSGRYYVIYNENIENEGTGIYHSSKKVKFDIGIDAKNFAIYGSILGTILNFVLIAVKYYRKSNQKG
jgi:hypothetical protein